MEEFVIPHFQNVYERLRGKLGYVVEPGYQNDVSLFLVLSISSFPRSVKIKETAAADRFNVDMELRLDSGVHVYIVQCGACEDADSSPLLWHDAVCSFAYFAFNLVLVLCSEIIVVPSGTVVAMVDVLVQSRLAGWAWCCLVRATELWVRRSVHPSTLQALLKEVYRK